MAGLEPRVGDRVGRYLLESPLGTGGFASVWVARDASGQGVVIKLLRAEVAVDGPARTRFVREVGVLADLDHPGIVRLIGHDLGASPPYFVMERVVGQALRDRLIECSVMHRPLSVAKVVEVVRALADAIAYAHSSGVVHRDLKPANVLLDVTDAPRVLDFGMARLMGADRHAATTLGRIMGTRYYWAPEQAMGEEAGPATDQFCLATIAFEILTLRRAWVRGEGDAEAPPIHLPVAAEVNRPLAILERLRSGPRPLASRARAGLPVAVDGVLERAWSTSPAARYPDVRSFEAAFSEALREDHTRVVPTLMTQTTVSPMAVSTRRAGAEVPAVMPMASDMGTAVYPLRLRGERHGSGARMVVFTAVALSLGVGAYYLAQRSPPTETPIEAAPASIEVVPASVAPVPRAVERPVISRPPTTATVATPAPLVTPSPPSPPTPRAPRSSSEPRAQRIKAGAIANAPASRSATLRARLDELAARPDLAKLAAFADQLDALAERIPSDTARARVRRLVATGSALGDVTRLRQALAELERAGALE